MQNGSYQHDDLMFSGHSLFFIASGNMLNNNYIKILGPFLLVVARYHYTIDVCVSGLVYFLYIKIFNLNKNLLYYICAAYLLFSIIITKKFIRIIL